MLNNKFVIKDLNVNIKKDMGLFSRPKCPVHQIEYCVDKDYMCQPYYFCRKCRSEKNDANNLKQKIKDIEKRIKLLESK